MLVSLLMLLHDCGPLIVANSKHNCRQYLCVPRSVLCLSVSLGQAERLRNEMGGDQTFTFLEKTGFHKSGVA